MYDVYVTTVFSLIKKSYVFWKVLRLFLSLIAVFFKNLPIIGDFPLYIEMRGWKELQHRYVDTISYAKSMKTKQ